MKRRWIIAASTTALYVALIAVIWVTGTEQAHEKTEAQLDYAILDFRDTVGGAIDTMLDYVAKTAIRRLGKAQPRSLEEMAELARALDIDEINVVDRTGHIIASNDPTCPGVDMAKKAETLPFLALTNGVTPSVSQPFRKHAYATARRKYLGVAFLGGDGFVQVGLDERHLSKMLPSILGCIFDEWLLGKTGFFLCADLATDRLISNPSRHRDEASTLADTGFNAEAAKAYEIQTHRDVGRTFRQRLFGEVCYCRNFVFGGHRFIPALPQREYYDTRMVFVTVFGVVLFIVLTAFGFFVDRIFLDSDRLKAFYAAEEERRAKDLLLAKTIQNAALPGATPESQYFQLAAAMIAAKEVGGDFYDYFPLGPTHYAFLIADVSGKGITAALYMMTAKAVLKDSFLDLRDPAAALTRLNEELCKNNPASMFLTAWAGMLNLETGTVTFANAGHNPPVFLPAPGSGDDIKFLNAKSGPAIAFMENVSYVPRTITLAPGDSLFLYTDGVTEAMDQKNVLFGEERLADTLREIRSSRMTKPSSAINVARAAVAAFSEGTPQADDITILSIKYLAPPRVVTRSFPCVREAIADATAYLDETLAAAGCPAAVHTKLDIILDEITSNIVNHSGASGFEIDVAFVDNPSAVRLTFTDDGAPYNPLAHIDPDITLSAEERPIGGLGILMVKRMSDAVEYSRVRSRNVLTILKKYPASGEQT